MTAPPACLASLPVSSRRVFWPTAISRVCIFKFQAAKRKLKPGGFEFSVSGFLFLLADVQSLDEIRVALRVFAFEVVEKTAAFADKHQQATAGMVVLRVRLEMLGEVVDALAENGHLYFRGTGVSFVGFVVADQLCLTILGQRH